VCDDIAVLDAGTVVEHGTRTALTADPSSRYAQLRRTGAAAELA
jgi:ABC-type dipeptide/oligopeptide/nickel transport system ATPase component